MKFRRWSGIEQFIIVVMLFCVLGIVFFSVIGYQALKELDGCVPTLVERTQGNTTSTSIECVEKIK